MTILASTRSTVFWGISAPYKNRATAGSLIVEYLVVAGGGGGGYDNGGGGGAGGFRTATGLAVSPGSAITVTVGNFGSGSSTYSATADSGGNSVFGDITAVGGGGGGSQNRGSGGNGANGGSGGGRGLFATGSAATGVSGQGNNGGLSNNSDYGGGGGGGAGAVGANGPGSSLGGNGGVGREWPTGSGTYYAGGGGAGGNGGATNSLGGNGGGGAGSRLGSITPTVGTPNTGGGGGGGGGSNMAGPGAAGGSGVVILKYSEIFTITIGSGLTGSTTSPSGGYKITTITAGTGTVSWSGGGSTPALYAFTTHTFTTASTVGRFGPTLSTLQSAYSAQSWASNSLYFFQGRAQGYQVWQVPQTGIYEIQVAGARGQASNSNIGYGLGAVVRARVSLSVNDKLEMVVGQVPGNSGSTNPGNSYAGSGGGSFIGFYQTNTPLMVAGGGAGLYNTWTSVQSIHNGQTRRQPRYTGYNYGLSIDGTNPVIGYGGGGYHGGGGGGWFSAGQDLSGYSGSAAMSTGSGGQNYTHGASFVGGPVSADGTTWYAIGGNATALTSEGGFGGGGGGHSGNNSSGGGGGYSGGLGGTTIGGGSYLSGIGGGSYIIPSATAIATSDGQYDGSSTSITNLGAFNDGAGYISITLISGGGGGGTITIPDPALWYKNSSIASLSNGSNISTWANSGTFGTQYNLTSGSGLGAAVPTKQVDSGTAAAYFDGSKFLRFSSQSNITFFPTSQFKQWTIFVVYRDGNGTGNFGFLGRYGADGVNGSIGMWPNGAGNFNQVHTNDGFPVNFAMPADESKLQRGIRWGTPTSNDGTITYWDGTSGTSSTSWSAYGSDLQVGGIGTARTTYNNGYLYELILYERALSDTEITTVRTYLNSIVGQVVTAPVVSGSVEYTSAGTFTWTATLTGTVRVFVVGGGGGGREGSSGGGGGGGSAVGTVSVSLGTVYNIIVGVGGAFQTSGGTTSALGLTATGGVSQAGATGGAGGTGSGGTEGNYTGGRGGDSSGANGSTGGGGGGTGGTSIPGDGGGGGAAGTGSVAGRTVPSGGGGGSSYGYGGGAGGAGANGGTAGENGATNGYNIPPGGGTHGGGSGSGNWGGGAGGGRGYVRIDWPA